jgi:cytoskeletal protein RodZ
MSELGRLLVEARTAKNLSLADVETATRVRQKYLAALEQGNFAALPPGTIARGFLRNYTRYLGLDPAQTLQLYTQESGDPGPVAPIVVPNHNRSIDYRPLEVSLMSGASGGGVFWRWLLALGVIVALLVGGSWWLDGHGVPQEHRGLDLAFALGLSTVPVHPGATSDRPLFTDTPAAVATQGSAAVAVDAAPSVDAPGPSPTSDLFIYPVNASLPSPTAPAMPTFTPTPQAGSSVSLTIRITQRAWVSVTVDGKVMLTDLLEAGQVQGWQVSHDLTILTGNAGGVLLTMNHRNLGAMGEAGEVVRRSWVVNQNGAQEVLNVTATEIAGPVAAGSALPGATATP